MTVYCLQRHVFVNEKEIHFLIYCPLYESIRNAYLPEIVKPCDSELVFKHIMCHTQPEKVFMLSKFLLFAFNLRETHV